MHNPDSWEGWYWGAAHHWGQSARNGGGETYGTVEDLLKHAEMVVFWSTDPEATSGVYGAHDGTIRRQWLKELGIPLRPHRPVPQPHGRSCWAASGSPRGRAPTAPWCWPSPTSG